MDRWTADEAPGGAVAVPASPLGAVVLPPGVLERLTAGLTDQLAVLYDVRPADPRAHFDGDTLVYSFQGGLTLADEELLESVYARQLCDFRQSFLEAVGGQLGSVVSALTGGRVVFFSAAFDPRSRTTNCYFTLAEDPEGAREQRRAIISWSEQVRRNARALRERHAESRAAHQRLRELLKEARGEVGGYSDRA